MAIPRQFDPRTLAFEAGGVLYGAGDKAVLFTYPFICRAHVYGVECLDDPKAACWNTLIGPERSDDTFQYVVICRSANE